MTDNLIKQLIVYSIPNIDLTSFMRCCIFKFRCIVG